MQLLWIFFCKKKSSIFCILSGYKRRKILLSYAVPLLICECYYCIAHFADTDSNLINQRIFISFPCNGGIPSAPTLRNDLGQLLRGQFQRTLLLFRINQQLSGTGILCNIPLLRFFLTCDLCYHLSLVLSTVFTGIPANFIALSGIHSYHLC